MDYGLAQGAERATGNLNATGMKLMEFQANRQLSADKLNLEQQRINMEQGKSDVETATKQLQLEQAQKQIAENERNIDFTMSPKYMSLSDQGKQNALNFMQSNGYVNDSGIGPKGKITEGLQIMGSTPELFKTIQGDLVEQKKEQATQAFTDLQNATLTADPKKIQEAQARFRALSTSYQAEVGDFSKHLDEITKQQEAVKLKQMEIDATGARNTETQTALDRRSNETNATRLKAAGILAAAKNATGGGIPSLPVGGGVPGEINQGALQGLSSAQKETVKAIAEYRFPVSNLRNKEMMALVQRAYLYDPTFDAKEYSVKSNVRKDFTSGTSSKTVVSLNTAIGHLESLAKSGAALENRPLQWWNQVANYGLTKTGDPRVTRFNTDATAVSGELSTVFKNTSGTDQEIKAWRQGLSAAQSPQQIKEGGVDEAVKLIGSRLDNLQNKYEQGMGRPIDFKLLSPKSRRILQGLGVDVNKYDPAGNTTGAGTTGAALPQGLKVGW